MSVFPPSTQNVDLDVRRERDHELIAALCSALGSPVRIRIIYYLQFWYVREITKMSSDLSIPMTTLMHHLEKLADAGVVILYYKYSKRASVRMAAREMKNININLYFDGRDMVEKKVSYSQSVGVGCYSDYSGDTVKLLLAENRVVSIPGDNFPEERFNSLLVFTNYGRISYSFSNGKAKSSRVKEIVFTFEICSEAPFYDNNYLSDITFWVNGVELTTYTLIGDFGDRRGKLNPAWWPAVNTQYGQLVRLSANKNGVMINGNVVNPRVNVDHLMLDKGHKTEFTFGNKDTAEHRGGFNLFGRSFGDYPQDICMELVSEE